MAMALVIEALKLQPCSPGFVDGRDAILAADQALNNGVNECLIWNVFAARGLGESASQGSRNSRTDQNEAFDVPSGIQTPLTACISTLTTLLNFELLDFKAIAVENKMVSLSWSAKNEADNDRFIIQRSDDAISFEDIGSVKSAGMSQIVQHYSFSDNFPFNAVSYYRIKQVDISNQVSFSEIKPVVIDNGYSVRIIPNPGSGFFNLLLNCK